MFLSHDFLKNTEFTADDEGMSLLDGEAKSSLPSMSWDSVVGGKSKKSTDEPAASTPPPPPAPPAPPAPGATDAPGAPAEPAPSPSPSPSLTEPAVSIALTFDSKPVDAAPPAPPAPPSEPAPAPLTSSFSTPTFTPTPSPAPTPIDAGVSSPSDLGGLRPARLEEPDFDPAAEPRPRRAVEPEPDPVDELKIVEATPVPELTADQQADVAASNTSEMPITAAAASAPTEAAPADTAPAPSVPTPAIPTPAPAPAQPSGFSLPKQAAVAPTASGFDPLSVDISKQSSAPARRQRKSGGSGFGLVLVLLLLAGLIAAGVVFGRPYLFPDEWDESAKAYAEDIEAIRGVDFVEPLLVVSEPTAAYRARVGDQLLGDWEAQMPMWRAHGLAAGGTERDVLDSLIVERSPAILSATDGQVYHDAALPLVDLDPQVTRAMAIAALDQDFSFNQTAASRTLLDEAMTDAHVAQQATDIQQRSSAPTAIRPTDDSPLAFLPPVLDYQLVAPTVLTELLPAIDDVAANPLEGIGRSGPGPLESAALDLAPPALLGDGETLVGNYQPMDREYWFMVFATHVDVTNARRMSNELSAASVGELGVAGETCFSSTFQSTTAEGTAALTGDLNAWAGAAAAELQATVTAVDDNTVQLHSCDPGDDFTSNARFGVARSLVKWQATELATVTGVMEAGGTQAQLDTAMAQLAASDAVSQVLAVELTASATEVAEAARRATAPIVAAAIAPPAPVEE